MSLRCPHPYCGGNTVLEDDPDDGHVLICLLCGRERSLPSPATLELRRFLVAVKAHPELIRGRQGRAPRNGASTRTVA
jgi:hypothetical protein